MATQFALRKPVNEARMKTKALKVQPVRFEYLEIRAKQEGISVSELLNRMVDSDEELQGLRGKPDIRDFKALDVESARRIAEKALRDGKIDQLECSSIVRAFIRAANSIVNEHDLRSRAAAGA